MKGNIKGTTHVEAHLTGIGNLKAEIKGSTEVNVKGGPEKKESRTAQGEVDV